MPDELDRKIINCLLSNARMSYKQMGQEVGLTSPAVAQRVQKLEEEGLLKGYTATVDYERLGYLTKAIISIKLHEGKVGPFMRDYKYHGNLLSLHRVTGEDCLLMHGRFKNNQELIRFIEGASAYGVTKTSIVLDEHLGRENVMA